MKNLFKYSFLIVLAATLLLASCQYDFVVEPAPPDPGDTISFSATILPIFNENCVSCHGVGGIAPDLSEQNAYSSLQTSGMINKDIPEDSEIYTYPSASYTDKHIWKKYTETEAALVLLWIEQGALNN
jgi:mono/diheme cytochrome c family protein